jgi:hypothetical protein
MQTENWTLFTQFLAGVAIVAGFIGAVGKLIVVRHETEWINWSGWMKTGKVMEALGPLVLGTAGLGALLALVTT